MNGISDHLLSNLNPAQRCSVIFSALCREDFTEAHRLADTAPTGTYVAADFFETFTRAMLVASLARGTSSNNWRVSGPIAVFGQHASTTKIETTKRWKPSGRLPVTTGPAPDRFGRHTRRQSARRAWPPAKSCGLWAGFPSWRRIRLTAKRRRPPTML